MASVLDVSVTSESEDDTDYIPPENEGSCGSCDDSGNISDNKLSKKYDQNVSKSKYFHDFTENSKIFPTITEKKKHAEDMWNNFLSDISDTKNSIRSIETLPNCETEMTSQCLPTLKKFELNEKTNYDLAKSSNSLDSTLPTEENVAVMNSSKHLPGKRMNIESVLQVVQNKRQKTNVFQKALHQWNNYKRSEGIEEDLRNFNKGKQGFLERQKFLQRSDLRCFETEKMLRQSLKKA